MQTDAGRRPEVLLLRCVQVPHFRVQLRILSRHHAGTHLESQVDTRPLPGARHFSDHRASRTQELLPAQPYLQALRHFAGQPREQ